MEFATYASSRGVAIKATGAINTGDAFKFQRLISAATVDDKGLRRIILESPGGDVVEATRIARMIRSNDFVTLVTGECASACAMVLYPAGQYFMLLDGGKLGFHTCYSARDLKELPECTKRIAQVAAEHGFPYGSIKVFAGLAGPREMFWITNVSAYCYGMEHFVGDPAPGTIENICPTAVLALINAKFQESDRPLGPSFDCNKATLAIEHLLCRDSELMQLDALMGKLFRMIRKREGGRDTSLLRSQREWISEREEKCPISVPEAESLDIVGLPRDASRK